VVLTAVPAQRMAADAPAASNPAPTRIALERSAEPTPLERLLGARRSVRSYAATALTLRELGDLAWAAQGVSSPRGLRTAPSAGARYPLELYVACPAGVYHYECNAHAFSVQSTNDIRAAVGAAAHGQPCVVSAPAQFIFSAVPERITDRYGQRGILYTDLEAGHAAQNLMLRAVELGLGTVAIGAFDPAAVDRLLGLEPGESVLYIICVGHPSKP